MYQGFCNDLMMLMGNLMQWKFRIPSLFKNTLYKLTEKTINDVMTKSEWKKDEVSKTVATVRQYRERLGFSEKWITEFVYQVTLLAKKEPKKKKKE
jgi:aspartate ammonia-lyase